MAKRELPVTDYAILGSLSPEERRSHLRRFCAHIPKESYAPTREQAGRCFEEVTDLFVLPPLQLAVLESLIRSEANVYSIDINLKSIRALWKDARSRNVRVRRYHPLPLRISPTRAIKGLVRYIASDEDGPFFPVIEPRVPKYNDRTWELLASMHREQCCRGEFNNARVAIVRFPKVDPEGNRKIDLVWDHQLPSFSKDEIDLVIAEVDALHDVIHPVIEAEKAEKQRQQESDQPDLFEE